MNYDMLEMEVIRTMDAKGLSGIKPKEAAEAVWAEASELIDLEMVNNVEEIPDTVGNLIVSLIAYCDARHINLAKCLELVVKKAK